MLDFEAQIRKWKNYARDCQSCGVIPLRIPSRIRKEMVRRGIIQTKMTFKPAKAASTVRHIPVDDNIKTEFVRRGLLKE